MPKANSLKILLFHIV